MTPKLITDPYEHQQLCDLCNADKAHSFRVRSLPVPYHWAWLCDACVAKLHACDPETVDQLHARYNLYRVAGRK